MKNDSTKAHSKRVTFNFFNYKWSLVPMWAQATETIYRKWYLDRYGYKDMKGLKKFLADKRSICEAGCGLARDSKMFAEANPKAQILAVDQSREAVKAAHQTLVALPNCQVLRADITNFSPKRKIDFISCDQVVHHTPDAGKTIRHFYDLLNTGGVINFSVCKKKNEYRDLADDLIMAHAETMKPEELWKFGQAVTMFAKALYDLNIKNAEFRGKKYENLQRYIHNNVFRAWYNPDLPFELSVSSNYDWFSGNPRFNADDVRKKILKLIPKHRILRFNEDDAVISVSLKKL